MSNYKERFISALENQKKHAKEEERFYDEYFKNLHQLHGATSFSSSTIQKTPEEIKAYEEKRKKEAEEKAKKELKRRIQYAKNIFKSHKKILIDDTLETFIVQMNKGISTKVSYEINVCHTYLETTLELQKIILSELQKELPDIPNMSLQVSIKNASIDHTHEEINYYGYNVTVKDFTEHKLIITINLTF